MPWTTTQIKQFEHLSKQVLCQQQPILASNNQDFGRLVLGQAAAVFKPTDLVSLQDFLSYAHQHYLPVTIRANGLSQAGQSLSTPGGISLDIKSLNDHISWQGEDSLSVGCSVSFKKLIKYSLEKQMLPWVFPYNTNLTLGGVLSVGGLGASSFKYGVVSAYIESLNVILASGERVFCSKSINRSLYDACLCGTGLFGVMESATLSLRPVFSMVTVVTLTYDDFSTWLDDQFLLRSYVNHMEALVIHLRHSPEYRIMLAVEHDGFSPDMSFFDQLHFKNKSPRQKMLIYDFVCRHDARFHLMQESGLWNAFHPWYECYIPKDQLQNIWPDIVAAMNENVSEMCHIFPIHPTLPKYFMMPDGDNIVTINFLMPGIFKEDLASTLASLKKINDILIEAGGKRYISGWFAQNLTENYWQNHYNGYYQERLAIKNQYDPHGIFCSSLFPTL